MQNCYKEKCKNISQRQLQCTIFIDGKNEPVIIKRETYSCELHASKISANEILHDRKYKRIIKNEFDEAEKGKPDFTRSFAIWLQLPKDKDLKKKEQKAA